MVRTTETFRLTNFITNNLVRDLRRRIAKNLRQGGRISLFIDQIVGEGGIASKALPEAIRFYMDSPQFPNLQTVAGPNVWQAGFFIFMAGRERRVLPDASFKMNWNAYLSTMLISESQKEPGEILRLFDSQNSLNAARFLELGIADGYYIGQMPPIRRSFLNRFRAPP